MELKRIKLQAELYTYIKPSSFSIYIYPSVFRFNLYTLTKPSNLHIISLFLDGKIKFLPWYFLVCCVMGTRMILLYSFSFYL